MKVCALPSVMSCYERIINPMTIFLAMVWYSYLEIIATVLAIASCLLQPSAINTCY